MEKVCVGDEVELKRDERGLAVVQFTVLRLYCSYRCEAGKGKAQEHFIVNQS